MLIFSQGCQTFKTAIKEKKRQARQSEQAQRNIDDNRSSSQTGNTSLPPPPPSAQPEKDKTAGTNLQSQFASNVGAGFMTGSFISSKGTSNISRLQCSNTEQSSAGMPPLQDVGISSNFMPAVNFQTGQSLQKKETLPSGGFMPGMPHNYPAYGSNESTGNSFSSRKSVNAEQRNNTPGHYGGQTERGHTTSQSSRTFYEQLSPAGDLDRSKSTLQSEQKYNYKSLKGGSNSVR